MTPDQKRLGFAAGCAATAGLLALGFLHWRERELLHQGEELRILAAKRYLPAYTRLKAGDLAWAKVPRAFAPTGVVSDADSVLGQQTLVPFSAEEPLIYNKLSQGDQSLAASIPEGRRALSVGISAISGVSGLLNIGDRVDVYLLHGPAANTAAGLLLQDIQVLATGGRTTRADNEGSHDASTVTLALTPDEAALILPASSSGQLHLALRASGDERPSSGVRADFGDAIRRAERGSAAPAAGPAVPRAAAPIDSIPSKR